MRSASVALAASRGSRTSAGASRQDPSARSTSATTSRSLRSPATTIVAPEGWTLAEWKATRSSGVIAEIVSLAPAVGREARSSGAK